MIAASSSRLVSGFVDAGVLVVFLPLFALALLVSGPVARGLATSRALAALALAAIAGILAVTLGVRAVDRTGGLGGAGFGDASLRWMIDASLWSHAIDIDSGWLLNLVLFIPAGLFVALATRRPVRAGFALGGLSLLIEIVQSLGLLGAPDPADLVANSLGAWLGAGLAAIALRTVARPVDGGASPATSRNASLFAAATVALAAVGWLGLLAGADARRDSLANELSDTFADFTSTDIAARFDTDDGFTELLSAVDTRPSYLGRVGETDQFEGRYSIEFFGFHRCVFIRWTADGFTLRNGSGDECTVFREQPPNR